ncbi:Mrp/NBP35 family ATP-binding protein [Sphingomicrobium clamense]|uniref:Iron-sulfur cluster carrier protein n=1 Tax=Sphingomicrobium clamense TaxID=2851013 RepID=A0ABS6V5I4_9SPHN|nr:Mrp/NBP35 family ATP-binding protein [Sphingomicrobium sp. B8]MBW0144338.1 Mrp/NBP35 family ATP-binding protein [Sphingomicrobium sp. B8]
MTDSLQPLESHPDAARIRAKVLREGRLHLILDGEGLARDERDALEARLTEAARVLDGVEAVEIAISAPKVHRKLVAIGSGKGGVGKSTMTANLAAALAKKGVKVGVIDADIYGPSQPTLLNAHAKPEARDKQLIPVTSPSGVKLLSVGQLVEAGTALAWRGPMASGALNQLVEGDWGDTEVLLVDLPPGTGDVQLSLVQKAKPAGALVISTPQDLSLIDATRAIDLFEKVGVPVLGLVENMAGYRCPHCGEESDPFGSGGAQASAKELGVPFLGRLPLSASLREASDAGRPPASEDGPAGDAFATLADALMSQLETIAR